MTFPWKLVSYRTKNNATSIGVLDGSDIIDLSSLAKGMRELLGLMSESDLTNKIQDVVKKRETVIAAGQTTLLASVTEPRMFYDFLGFEKHVRQIRDKRGDKVPELWYQRPAYYVASTSADKLFGPGEVRVPTLVEKPDYEFEIALVVAKKGKLQSVEEAREFVQKHCFFTLFNDWSARDFQKLDMQLGLGVSHSKTMIGSTLGPCLVHASQFKFDPEGRPDIKMTLHVNKEVRSESNYNTVHWDFAKILAFLGKENISVFSGDILGSGTVGDGCIAEFAAKVVDGKEIAPAKYDWLKNGDEITLEASGIGTLSSTVKI